MTDNNGFVPTEKMLDPTGLAQMLRISERHFTDLRSEDGSFPKPRMLGSLPRWSSATIRAWVEQANTNDPAGSGALPPASAHRP